ncbi:hypothetical protein COV53_04475 [Candidatus Gottesmanbacteria bacterium CG11_big_fil_rev_8_21_14_0_20_37_11]|uniref:Nucleotide-diphospho-sugar transferase domain-containing protein n=4 Tax=Microgenomates group TaxID=1794810 RepID=A0A1J5AZH6_9BACT|nr:MAG: hypothetical protein AUK18_01005 [Candidatus Beckwithbacteria bacterium CG2_30_44_31]PIP14887.1 MAG: hypothetical protein COX47_02750 [Candidatus Roizmanbacteria bacterium CG23_combo_of_CG06-09_8_20_14_all_35_49]PIR08156.1 MAG: hypothetical protein COV53_04475 [Candidatus Gottesmanbacteria bacterium CG11_big_fil_rev_8_21_14_0_20_37_11]PIV09963.1 MAG: hypothetical protein COS51_00400 [Candidatus Roizmanbacteria bacterium CG03_land_8_20_14_0_80_36_21]PIV38261.1 MAG: hypothetical protein C
MAKINCKKTRHIVIGSDANYLHKAVVFYKSLSKFHNNFVLHIFCFDDIAYKVLRTLNYKNIITYHTSEFENKELLKVKAAKERMYEYYWTCNPAVAIKVIKEQKTDFISLADCDLMFFQSPEVIYDEFEGADAIIQPNNFSYQHVKDFIPVGYYCTSFQCFRNNDNGRKILEYWYRQCLKWCSAEFEEGRFGDQKYLDDWKIRFKKVSEVANIGTNVAPWNVQKFNLSQKNNQVVINNKWPLVYYHYHSFRMNFSDYAYIITGDRENSYKISRNVINLVYKPYIKETRKVIKNLKKIKEYQDYVKLNPRGVQKDFQGRILKKYSKII